MVGDSIDQIQALNPELRRWTTPVKGHGYELKFRPHGGACQRAAWLESDIRRNWRR